MTADATTPLDQVPITRLRGVGSQLRDRLARIGLTTVQDALFHLPIRYLDRTRVTAIGALQANTEVVIEGEVRGADIVVGRRRSLMCKLQDATGTTTLRFFHFTNAQRVNLRPGTRLRCYGEVRLGSAGLELYHPEYQFLDRATPAPLAEHMTPVYPAGEGLTQARLRHLVDQALALITPTNLVELLPRDLMQKDIAPVGQSPARFAQATGLADALRFLHQPPATAPVDQLSRGTHPAQQRLAFEELLAHHLSLLRLRQRIRCQSAPVLQAPADFIARFIAALPFALTAAQTRVAAEISRDLAASVPTLRLLQGDVGSGKTLVAALATLHAIGSGAQAALMAPTEILAEQHRNSFAAWFAPLGIRIGWLTGKLHGKARAVQLATIADGSAQLVIGTHALFQDEVVFHNLGLTIIDEQHRFGVHQRLALRNKGRMASASRDRLTPHQLIMTATPIPRTLAMSAYADLDCSVIDELPPGRTPVNTVVIGSDRRRDVVERVRNACRERRQAYWVCTLIEASEVLEAQAAEATATELGLLLPEIAIGLIHGRLKPGEKARVMAAFKAGDVQLLVATTVIEVGVDVPNASLMVIENPERLGLAQLHQLRGRIGRGSTASHCVLLYRAPLSQLSTERLKIMRQTNDGFVIADKDLELRGPGEVLGTRQTGEMNLHIADLQRDSGLLPWVKMAAARLVEQHPAQVTPLIRRWLGENERYGEV